MIKGHCSVTVKRHVISHWKRYIFSVMINGHVFCHSKETWDLSLEKVPVVCHDKCVLS